MEIEKFKDDNNRRAKKIKDMKRTEIEKVRKIIRKIF